MGIPPIIPFHIVLNLIVTFLTRTSTIAALLASLIVCNPLTYVPQYYISIVVGNAMTPYNLNWERMRTALDILLGDAGVMESLHALADLGYEAIIVLLVGGLIIALQFTMASYFLSLRLFIKIREKRRRRQAHDPMSPAFG